LSIRWQFNLQGNLGTSFKYWRRQLTFISAEETLRRVMNCLDEKKPGAYLRFGRADIDTALGIRKPGEELSDSLVLEICKSFLLSGENIFKALHVECPALGLPFRARATGVSDCEAIDRLNAVGACFLDWPIHSYTAFARNGLEQPDLLEQVFESLKACQPILIFKEGDARESAIEKLAPRISTAIAGEDIYKSIDWLEDEIQRIASSAANGFPVVVLALGVAGRALVKRLVKRGFPGFLMDLDNLHEIPFDTKPDEHRSFPRWRPRKFHLEKPEADSGSAGKLPVRWEGPFLGHYSYSVINRELCSRLCLNDRIELSIQPSDTPFSIDPINPANSNGFHSIVDRVGKPLTRAAEIHICNHAQHPYQPPREGRWVVIQPWDYMSLPVRWVEWIRTQIDEVWVPSSFVRSAFLEAGIPQERVAVVPNGVNVRLYQPNARKVKLNTKKSFKFLFVGGSFWRKGFDILLEAYGKAFSSREDVSLVIKSVPEFWTSAGTKRLAEFRSRAGAPELVSIVESLDQELMAGLYATCNCLVHPYRAEGFAICVAEGMACGLPVIVTGMGGSTDFCNPHTAFLVPAKLCQMSEKQLDNEPTLDYPAYAEPELDGLVEWIRYVFEHPQESRAIARVGMNKIRAEFTWDVAAEIAAQRLFALENKPFQRLT
jgi:glycosyltransferase involved in cell wall biosynthesis